MLKKHQYFFVVLFLGSMLFTVFQYVPILEEEVHASKTLNKKSDKASENDGGDDDSGDDDENDSDEFFDNSSLHSYNLVFSNTRFHIYKDDCRTMVFNINTPPPKI